jgi:NAD(P)-dependent dehydrogenase (short-subunit alcohol dehydrogenase family)
MQDKTLVIIGGSSGIARQIATDSAAAGAKVVLAARNPDKLEGLVDGVTTARVDLGDEESIRNLAEQVGTLDYLVTSAAAPANGPVVGLEREAVLRAFDAKVIGPLLLAKHFAPRFAAGGAMLLFSGIVGWRPSAGKTVMTTANGAVSFLAAALAVELAPIRVNAISPGIVDSGAWDGLGEGKTRLFEDTAARIPVHRVGRPADISAAALLALTNPFLTGETLHLEGGARLV